MAPATAPAPAPAPARPAGRAARRITGQVAGSAGGSTLALALLVFACVFVALAAPALGLRTQTEALRQQLARQPPIARAVQADADWGSFTGQLGSGAAVLTSPQLASATTALARGLAAAGLPAGSGAQAGNWAGLATNAFTVASGAAPSANAGVPPRMEVLYRDQLARYTQVVAGRYSAWPGAWGSAPGRGHHPDRCPLRRPPGLPAPAGHPVRAGLPGRHRDREGPRARRHVLGLRPDRGRPQPHQVRQPARVLLGGRGAG